MAGGPEPRGQRHDRAPHDSVPRRGREAGRPNRDPPRRHDHRVGHIGGAKEAGSAREGRIRRTAADPGGDLPGDRCTGQEGQPMNAYLISDTSVMTRRMLRHVTRSVDTIITVTVMPIAFMLLFVYVFGGAIQAGTDNYVNYLLPGILLIAIASGISYTAYRLFIDLQSGIFERFHSMPIARSSVLWGHVLTSLVSNAISVVVIVLVGLVMGFRSSAGVPAWLAVAGSLGLFTLALPWIAVIAGLSATSTDGAGAFSYPIIFLPFVSSAFVPTASMPGPVRAFAENQPVTSIVNTIRALFAQQPVGGEIWIALAWCVGILVIAYAFAMRAYRRKIA